MEPDFIKLRDIKPALTGYIKEAEMILKSAAYPDEDAVHDVRVLLKRSRSVLKIIAPQVAGEFAAREISALGETGKMMSLWRNRTVLRKSLKELKKRDPDLFRKLKNNEKINDLLKRPAEQEIPAEQESSDLEKILSTLKKTGYHLRFEPMTGLDPQLLLKELEATYIRVSNNYLICRNYQKPSNLHEFRKSSKDFLYQLWFFRPLNVPVIKSLEKKLDSLTQNLGRYNDLGQLLKGLGYKYEYTANPPELDELAVLIKEEQDSCLAKVWPLAHKIFYPGQKLVNVLGFKLLII